MITFGAIELNIKAGSMAWEFGRVQSVRHYPNTDTNDVVNKGKTATKLTLTLIAESLEQRFVYEAMVHSSNTADLTMGDYYYNDVSVGGMGNTRDLKNDGTLFEIDCQFICTEPVPYSVATDEAVY